MGLVVAFVAILAATYADPASAQRVQTPTVPSFWNSKERFIKPNLKGIQRLRFLTVTDFPPFSYIDREKRLSGFHVDLARAICRELEVLPVCQIQGLPFGEINRALLGGGGEAALAGHAITDALRRQLIFSRPYFRLPARFLAKEDASLKPPMVIALKDRSVGVVDGTSHAAYAQAYFGDMRLRLFATRDDALAALEKGEVEAVFGDALQLAFYLQRKGTDACCRFAGKAYLAPAYFGSGLAIASAPGNRELVDGINFALRAIHDKGIFAELYLRYFPISLY